MLWPMAPAFSKTGTYLAEQVNARTSSPAAAACCTHWLRAASSQNTRDSGAGLRARYPGPSRVLLLYCLQLGGQAAAGGCSS